MTEINSENWLLKVLTSIIFHDLHDVCSLASVVTRVTGHAAFEVFRVLSPTADLTNLPSKLRLASKPVETGQKKRD